MFQESVKNYCPGNAQPPLWALHHPVMASMSFTMRGVDDTTREATNCALIRIIKGNVTARQLENEFKAQAGPQSTWRWFAKNVSENSFQMKFPTSKKVEELSFFTAMQMGTVPDITFKVEHWNSNVGAKGSLETAWF